MQHITIPIQLPPNIHRLVQIHNKTLTRDKQYPKLNRQLKQDTTKKNKEHINNKQWGQLKKQTKTQQIQKKLLEIIANIHKGQCNTKISIDTKRILQLPNTPHHKVKHEIHNNKKKNIENYNPFDNAVPHFMIEKEK